MPQANNSEDITYFRIVFEMKLKATWYFITCLVLLSSAGSTAERIPEKDDSSDQMHHQMQDIEKLKNNMTNYTTTSTAIDNSLSKKEDDAMKYARACSADSECPPWTFCKNGSCVCTGHGEPRVKCDPDTLVLSVLTCNCVTYDNKTKQMFVGECIENCVQNRNELYYKLPFDVNEINSIMCEEKWKRTGRLCGKCLNTYSPQVYSFGTECVACEEGNKNFWKYILVAFGPLTVFYFIVLFFKIKANSALLHGYLYFSQAVAMPAFLRIALISTQSRHTYHLIVKIFGALYSVWNLDILRGLYPDLCLDVSPLTALAIHYSLAFYPIVLIILSYFLIELHDRNIRVVVFIWRPFRWVFMLFRRNWDTRTTVIDAYCTFFLLSFIKVLSVCFDLLIPTKIINLQNGNSSHGLYHDATVDFFGQEHLPYAIIAIVFGLIFTVLPTMLLVLYPFRCFRKALNCLKIRLYVLHAIMDSLHGCYKDGTEPGTRDWRHFAATKFIVVFILFSVYARTRNGVYFPLASAILGLIIIILINVQPYKNKHARYIKLDTFFLGLLAIFYAVIAGGNLSTLKMPNLKGTVLAVSFVTGIIPLTYMSCITTYWILSQMRGIKKLVNRARGYRQLEGDESFPDRVANPEQYTGENLQESAANTDQNDVHVNVSHDFYG